MPDQPQKRPSLLFVDAPGIELGIYLAKEERLLAFHLGELLLDLPGEEVTPMPTPLTSRLHLVMVVPLAHIFRSALVGPTRFAVENPEAVAIIREAPQVVLRHVVLLFRGALLLQSSHLSSAKLNRPLAR